MIHPSDSNLDPTGRRVRGLVKVCCEIYTETSQSVAIMVNSGRSLLIPKAEVDTIVREGARGGEGMGFIGHIVMSRWLADELELEYDD